MMHRPRMRPLPILVFLVLLGIFAYAANYLHMHGSEGTNAAEIIGRVEKVYIEDAKFVAPARIDTGAGVSSLGVEIVEIKNPGKPGGPERVVFRILDEKKQSRTLERDIVEWQNIKKKGGKEGYIKRPVVKLDICLGGKRVEARVNLADRSHFLYPVLIGRNTLKAGDFLIDPAKTFMHKPVCP